MSPFDAGSTEITPAHFAPAGSFAQFASSLNGFAAPPFWPARLTAAITRRATTAAADFTRRSCVIRSSRETGRDCSSGRHSATAQTSRRLDFVHARDHADEEVEPNPLALLQALSKRFGPHPRNAHLPFRVVRELVVHVVRQLAVNADWLQLVQDSFARPFQHEVYRLQGRRLEGESRLRVVL